MQLKALSSDVTAPAVVGERRVPPDQHSEVPPPLVAAKKPGVVPHFVTRDESVGSGRQPPSGPRLPQIRQRRFQSALVNWVQGKEPPIVLLECPQYHKRKATKGTRLCCTAYRVADWQNREARAPATFRERAADCERTGAYSLLLHSEVVITGEAIPYTE